MGKTNFEYSEELMERMSDMLKPDIISVMRGDIERAISKNEFKERFQRDNSRKDLITNLWVMFLGENPLIEEKTIKNSMWTFVFNAYKNDIVMSVCNMKTGVTFRYIVNSFSTDDLYETYDFMRLLVERMNNGGKEKSKEND